MEANLVGFDVSLESTLATAELEWWWHLKQSRSADTGSWFTHLQSGAARKAGGTTMFLLSFCVDLKSSRAATVGTHAVTQ